MGRLLRIQRVRSEWNCGTASNHSKPCLGRWLLRTWSVVRAVPPRIRAFISRIFSGHCIPLHYYNRDRVDFAQPYVSNEHTMFNHVLSSLKKYTNHLLYDWKIFSYESELDV